MEYELRIEEVYFDIYETRRNQDGDIELTWDGNQWFHGLDKEIFKSIPDVIRALTRAWRDELVPDEKEKWSISEEGILSVDIPHLLTKRGTGFLADQREIEEWQSGRSSLHRYKLNCVLYVRPVVEEHLIKPEEASQFGL